MVDGVCGGGRRSAPGHVEEGWSFPSGSVPTLSLRTEASTAKAKESATSPATYSTARTVEVSARPLLY